jgi:FemAB-related protein (PEP-CTERM system-associated)
MSSSIRKQLRKDPQAAIDALVGKLHSPDLQAAATAQLQTITEALTQEREKNEQRQRLSRKIGAAKKAGEDSAPLIEEVSRLSAEIDLIKQQIDNGLKAIAAQSAEQSDSVATDGQTTPQHLQPLPAPHFNTADLVVSHETVSTDEWREFVAGCERATIYHEPQWQSIIANYFKQNYYLVSCRDAQGQLVGVLPLVHVNSRIFGSFSVSMPYVNYGGPLSTCGAVEEALLQHAAQLSEQINCEHMEVRETNPRKDWQSTERKISMILPLPASDTELDKQLGSKLRAQVNKAASNDLTITFGRHDLLADFYRVFSGNMRDLGTPVYSKQLFDDILTEVPNEAFIAVVKRHGKPLAAGFLLGYRDKLEIPWASSVRRQNHLGANMFMYRGILREAINRGYQFFDFGRSTRDASTHRFKKQWGAEEHQLHWHYWTQGGDALPELNPDNPKFKLAIAVWQRLPVFVTTLIGPPLARNLP